MKLKERLAPAQMPNLYDLQAINRVFNIAEEEALSGQTEFSARQYSDAFVDLDHRENHARCRILPGNTGGVAYMR